MPRPVIELTFERTMRHELDTPVPWQDVLRAYSAWMRSATTATSTIRLRLYHLRRFATTVGLAPFEVTRDDLVTYLGARSWSRSTRTSHRSTLRGFYAWATLTGRLPDDPALKVPASRPEPGRPRPAPERAVRDGLRAADERTALMIELGARVGLRCCEIAAVHTDDVVDDLLGWSLRVTGKGGKVRVVPITDTIARRIRAHDGWVFPGAIDGHLSSSYVSKLVSRALPDGVTAHMLRHRFASAAYAADRDIRAVQELLGHTSVATTQVYTAVPDDRLRRAVAAAA